MTQILIVDDDEMFLEIYEDLLVDEGYTVTRAMDGKAALLGVEEQVPDLILMDLNMPEMNGFQVIRKLRGAAETAKTPILAITGAETEHVYEDIYEAGANGYLAKPINAERLLARIREMLPA